MQPGRLGRVLLGVCTIVSPAMATSITFDEPGLTAGYGPQQPGQTPAGTVLANQLNALGVVFSNNSVVNYVSSTAFLPGFQLNGNFLIVLYDPMPDTPLAGTLILNFFTPMPGASISFDLYDGNTIPSPRVVVRSFDGLGNPLQTLNLMTAGENMTFSLGSVASITFEDTGGDGFVIGDLSFGALSAPEPGSYLLLASGLAVVALARRRRRV